MFESLEIKKGPHSTEIPRGMHKLFEDFFGLVQFNREDYKLVVLLGEKIRGSGHCQPLEVKRIDPKRRSVVVAVKPGDNGTRFNCFLFRPEGYSGTEEDFFRSLKDAENKFNNDSEEIEESKREKVEIKLTDNSTQNNTETKTVRRIVKNVLDEETIKCILLEIQGAHEGKRLQSQLKKNIVALGVKCSESQVVKFLKKEGYLREEVVSRIKVYLSLEEKGLRLLESGKEQNKKEEPRLSIQSEDDGQVAQKGSSEIVDLSAQFEDLKARAATAQQNVELLEKQLSEAQNILKVLKQKKYEVKQKIIVFLE